MRCNGLGGAVSDSARAGFVGDKGYSSRSIRTHCRRRGIRITIPRKANERRTGLFDRAGYRLHHRVENLIARCKQYRSLAPRDDKRAQSDRALWLIAYIILWIKYDH